MLKNYFAFADVRLATQMWCDLQAAGADLAAYSETVWAAGIIYTFVKLNGAYTSFDERIAGFCGTEVAAMQKASETICEVLQIEKHGPRYSNEEDILAMLMSAYM